MISYYQFEQCIDWLTDRDELTKELDRYKQAPTNWSRKRTRELCNNVAVLTAPFWANNGHDRATASIVFDMVAKVIYRYIHAGNPDDFRFDRNGERG